MPVIVVAGLQWGDEGKGKIIDLLSAKADIIVRCQGGNNAGHTVIAGNKEYHFHLIPSGILFSHTRCFLGGGVIIEPKSLLSELALLKKEGVPFEDRFKISPFAQVIFPYHLESDRLNEERQKIGTTGRGIGPCFADRTARLGLRIADLADPEQLHMRLMEILPQKNTAIDEIYAQYVKYGEQLLPFIDEVEGILSVEIEREKNILLEGAQGTLLDVIFGTYPYVTSCNTTAAGIIAGGGIGPTDIDRVLGVLKSYSTRVGNGPFPTEMSEEEARPFHERGDKLRELGTTTRRKRRLGWFDAVAARFAMKRNSVDAIALTKLDILDELEVIKICTAYQIDDKIVTHFPAHLGKLKKAKPIYEEWPGWKSSTKHFSSFDDLPEKARLYLQRISQLCHAPIEIISTGPKRQETMILKEMFHESITS